MAMRQIGPGMIQQVPMKCPQCQGRGSNISEADKCTGCHGERVTKQQKTLEVFVTKGMRNGERITFKGEGDQEPDTIPGDVVVVLQMAEHPTFRREGNQLFVKRTLTLIEALTGFSFEITHLDGRVLRVKSDGTTVKPGDIKMLKEEGMPMASNPYVRGNMFVEFDVTFPTKAQLDEKAVRALSAVLPRPTKSEPRKSVPPPTSTGGAGTATDDLQDFYEVELVDCDMKEERRRAAQQEAEQQSESYDDDEDHHHGHGGRAQAGCQQQ